MPAVRHPRNPSLDYPRSNARIVENGFATSGGLNKSAKVVLAAEVGLKLVDSRGWMLTEIGRADFFLGSLQSYPILLPKAGVATPEEVQAFVDRQLRASEDGTFFAGYNFYAMIAERPSQ